MADGIVFIEKEQINLATMCIKKQYYFVTKYFILNFPSSTVSKQFREIGYLFLKKMRKSINLKLVFQRDF